MSRRPFFLPTFPADPRTSYVVRPVAWLIAHCKKKTSVMNQNGLFCTVWVGFLSRTNSLHSPFPQLFHNFCCFCGSCCFVSQTQLLSYPASVTKSRKLQTKLIGTLLCIIPTPPAKAASKTVLCVRKKVHVCNCACSWYFKRILPSATTPTKIKRAQTERRLRKRSQYSTLITPVIPTMPLITATGKI